MTRVLTIFAAVLLLAASVYATETRVNVLGDNNMVMEDDANIFLFPGRTFNYPNLGIGEFDSGDEFTRFGIHWKFGADNPWVLATYFSTDRAGQPFNLFDGSQFGNFDELYDFGEASDRRLDMFYGRQFSNFNFGFFFGYDRTSFERDDQASAENEKFSNYEFGFGLTDPQGDWDLAAMIAIGSWTDEDADGETVTEPDGYLDLSATGRYFWRQSPVITWVPHVMFAYGKHGEIDNVFGDGDPTTADDRVIDSKQFVFGGGMGLNYSPIANVLAVADVGFMVVNEEEEVVYDETQFAAPDDVTNTHNTFSLPYWKIGLEGDVFDWMDVRFGATSFWNLEKFETEAAATQTVNWKRARNDTFLGFGFHFGRLHIDTETDPEIVLDGFNFISGSEDADDLNFRVSVLYEMF